MRKLFLLLIISSAFTLKAQYYQFSKSSATYANLTGATVLANDDWFDLEQEIKNPFPFKYWGDDIIDSLHISGIGSIGTTTQQNSEIFFLGGPLMSRGIGKSPVSYKIEGTAPNRIFKVEFNNIGFLGDYPALEDSANVQCWIFETTNIIEFRYGTSQAKPSSYLLNGGPFIGMADTSLSRFIVLNNDPNNPTIKTDTAGNMPLNGLPSSGTIYRFTPSQFPNGINNSSVKINVVRNSISLPASMMVKSISIYNANGQIVQSAVNAESIDFSNFAHGLYVIAVNTKDGVLTRKLIL